jgi:protein-disulfide isomerase
MHEILRQYSRDVALVFVHTPLEGHRFAMQAARVVECADAMGQFVAMADAIFSKQDSLGVKSWGSYALDAGISDSASINACARDDRPIDRISAGKSLAEALDITGTPTVFVNGWRFLGPSKQQLLQAVEAARQGKAPAGAGTE